MNIQKAIKLKMVFFCRLIIFTFLCNHTVFASSPDNSSIFTKYNTFKKITFSKLKYPETENILFNGKTESQKVFFKKKKMGSLIKINYPMLIIKYKSSIISTRKEIKIDLSKRDSQEYYLYKITLVNDKKIEKKNSIHIEVEPEINHEKDTFLGAKIDKKLDFLISFETNEETEKIFNEIMMKREPVDKSIETGTKEKDATKSMVEKQPINTRSKSLNKIELPTKRMVEKQPINTRSKSLNKIKLPTNIMIENEPINTPSNPLNKIKSPGNNSIKTSVYDHTWITLSIVLPLPIVFSLATNLFYNRKKER